MLCGSNLTVYIAWLNRRNVSQEFMSDIDLQVLIECSVGLSLEPAVHCVFSDEDQEALVSVDHLPPRVRSGVRERSLGVMSLDSALALMLEDERTTMGQRASSARMLITTRKT